MLQLRNISFTMKKDLRTLLENFTFALQPGDKAAVIGEEGNGKSTLLKLIYDAALVEDFVEWSGTVQKDGLLLGYLPQELGEEDREKTAYEFCCGYEAFLDSTPGELAAIAGKLGIAQELFYGDRPMKTLSGGEKVKLRMAVLALARPDVLLLDEPSNDLDLETLDWLETFIRETPAAVLYISHDETLLERTATVILHMEQLRKKTLPRATVARMGYRQYVEERLHKFQHQEQVARKEREEEKKQQERFRQIYQKVEHQQNAVSRQDPHGGRLLKKKMKSVKSMERRLEREQELRTEVPDTEDAILAGFEKGLTIPAGKTVLDFSLDSLGMQDTVLARNLRLTVRGPEHLCIVGKNGVGKTTLLRQIAQSLLARQDIQAGYMPQDYGDAMDLSITPVEYLAKTGEKAELTKVKTYLGSMKYTPEECGHTIGALSGGQKAKLFFLKLILEGCNVLVLDEPTRNFSPLSGPVIREILRDFGGAILSVSHDRKYIGEVCQTLYALTSEGLKKQDNRYAEQEI